MTEVRNGVTLPKAGSIGEHLHWYFDFCEKAGIHDDTAIINAITILGYGRPNAITELRRYRIYYNIRQDDVQRV